MLITNINYVKASMEVETAFFGQLKYLNLVKVHIESVPSNPILCIPMEKQECFHIAKFKLILHNKEWTFSTPLLSLYYGHKQI